MSDPMNRPNPDPTRGNVPPPVDPPPGEERKGANPLVWILVLVALLALAWYFLSRDDGTPEPLPDSTAPIGQTETPAVPATDAGDTARSEPRRPARPVTPANREASVATQVEPEYPAVAMRSREEGTVVVRADVDASGHPTNVQVAKRSGSRELDRAAVDAVKQWTFEPAMRDGKAVASSVQVPVDFRLDQQ